MVLRLWGQARARYVPVPRDEDPFRVWFEVRLLVQGGGALVFA